MLSASTDLPQVQSYHNQYFYSLDFALFINKKQNKGGESLPLTPKQVAPRIVSASRADSLRFVACPPPLPAGQNSF